MGMSLSLSLSLSAQRPSGLSAVLSGFTLTPAGTGTATEDPVGTLNLTGDGTNQQRADKQMPVLVVGRSYTITFTVSMNAGALVIGTTQGGANIVAPTTYDVGARSVTFTATVEQPWIRFYKSGANLFRAANIVLTG